VPGSVIRVGMMKQIDEKKNISRHILPTASNLLGLCFVILGMIKIYAFGERTLLDEMTASSMVLFLAACLFSYASIRAKNKSERYEKIADILFLAGLIVMTLIAVVIAFEVVR
jgi:uncharacterized membrane protein